MTVHPLVARYGDPLAVVDDTPRSATEIYRRWAHLEFRESLRRPQRHERRWLAYELERLSRRRIIHRDITNLDNGQRITFWRDMDTADETRDQHRIPGQDAGVRAVGGVGQLAR